MNRERAKEILSVHRAGLDNEVDPEILEAYRMMDADPELAAWVEADRRFDAQFRQALSESPVPAQRLRSRSPGWCWWGIAAAAAVLIGAGLVGLRRPADRHQARFQATADFRDAMAYYAAGGFFTLDQQGGPLRELQAFMTARGGVIGEDLDRAFASSLPMGCKVIAWRAHQVSLYCFANDDHQIVHAFLIPADQLDSAAAAGLLEPRRLHGLETGGWIAGDTGYLLVASEPHISIEPFLGTGQRRVALVRPVGMKQPLTSVPYWP